MIRILGVDQMMEDRNTSSSPYGSPSRPPSHDKSKWIAAILAFFMPGAGHFYLGQMNKGLLLIMLIILDIVGIVYFTVIQLNIPLIVLLGLTLPVIYFYNIFDVILSTDKVNRIRMNTAEHADTLIEQSPSSSSFSKDRGTVAGAILIVMGVIFFLASNKPAWMIKLWDGLGTYIGAVILIVAGVFLFIKEMKKK